VLIQTAKVETTLAQVAGDQLGVPPGDVRLSRVTNTTIEAATRLLALNSAE